jgi:TRAP-type C4-dicarboxylate transport system substrate-binding protein
MRLGGVLAPLLALAVAAGCGPGGPNRAVTATPQPIVLSLASPLTFTVPLDTFVRQVTESTGGSVRIEVHSSWRKGQVDYETGLIGDVRAGQADLGVASSRAFDTVGVLRLRALHAPLLITSYAAERQVLASPIVARLLDGLRPAGLTGLGILPGDLRRPLGITGPLIAPADYRGRTIGTQQSTVADDTMRALGANPVRFPVEDPIDAFDGAEQQIISIQGSQYDNVAKFLTTNVVFWPRPLVLFSTPKGLTRLTPTQQTQLRQAAAAALPASVTTLQGTERESMDDLCRAGRLAFRQATPQDLTALRTAVQPVIDGLRRDPETSDALTTITSILGGVTAEPPPTCPQPSQAPAAGPSPLDGVYTTRIEPSEIPNDRDFAPENYGNWTMVFHGDRFAANQQYQNACTWVYGTLRVTGARLEMAPIDSGGAAPRNALNKPGELLSYGWSLYRDTLTFTEVAGAVSPGGWRVKPWHRVNTTPSAKYFAKDCPPPPQALG